MPNENGLLSAARFFMPVQSPPSDAATVGKKLIFQQTVKGKNGLSREERFLLRAPLQLPLVLRAIEMSLRFRNEAVGELPHFIAADSNLRARSTRTGMSSG